MPGEVKIVADQEYCAGAPRINGTRITVYDVVGLTHDHGKESVLEQWAYLSAEQIERALDFCAVRECDQISAWCGGCSLKTRHQGVTSFDELLKRWSKIVFSESDVALEGTGEGLLILAGSPENLKEEAWRGRDGWKLARAVRANRNGQ